MFSLLMSTSLFYILLCGLDYFYRSRNPAIELGYDDGDRWNCRMMAYVLWGACALGSIFLVLGNLGYLGD